MKSKYSFTGPGCYRIKVKGLLGQGWSDRIGAMQILPSSGQDQGMTVLQGCVSDQAELSGILNTLYELHLPLMAVQYIEDETTSPDAPGD